MPMPSSLFTRSKGCQIVSIQRDLSRVVAFFPKVCQMSIQQTIQHLAKTQHLLVKDTRYPNEISRKKIASNKKILQPIENTCMLALVTCRVHISCDCKVGFKECSPIPSIQRLINIFFRLRCSWRWAICVALWAPRNPHGFMDSSKSTGRQC